MAPAFEEGGALKEQGEQACRARARAKLRACQHQSSQRACRRPCSASCPLARARAHGGAKLQATKRSRRGSWRRPSHSTTAPSRCSRKAMRAAAGAAPATKSAESSRASLRATRCRCAAVRECIGGSRSPGPRLRVRAHRHAWISPRGAAGAPGGRPGSCAFARDPTAPRLCDDTQTRGAQNKALCLLKLSRHQEAADTCSRVLTQDPAAVKALFRRAQVCARARTMRACSSRLNV